MSNGEALDAPEALSWAVEQLRSGTADEHPERLDRFVAAVWREPAKAARNLKSYHARVGRPVVAGIARTDPDTFAIELRGDRERTWWVRIGLDDSARISRTSLTRPLPSGVSIRPARGEDWEALRQLETACPTRNAAGHSATIRRQFLREHFELQREFSLWVAEHEGRLVGARAFTVRECPTLDAAPRYAFSHFARILPGYQSKGIFQPLTAFAGESILPSTDGIFGYVDAGNEAIRGAFGGFPIWSIPVQRLALACGPMAGPAFGRRAVPGDAEHIVRLVNACHQREGFFAPYTASSLAERLSRVERAYGWKDLLISDHAVVGVWLAAEERRVSRDGVTTEGLRGLVLDYGFDPAAREVGLQELVRLLRSWCHLARDAGLSHLAIFSSRPSPGAAALASLADPDQTEDFGFPCEAPEPPGLAKTGLYVDPIYF